ncbi:MAG: ferritin-like domain-containing protein [Patulibacter minatonensis]
MSAHLDLSTLDPSGDIRTAAHDAGAFDEGGLARRDLLRRGAAAGGGLVVGAGLFQAMLSPAEAAISTKKTSAANDVKILNYALTLEYLEAAFYAQGNANKAWKTPEIQRFAEITGNHEAEHVVFLKKVLKKAAIKAPDVNFGDAVTNPDKFAATAQVLEDTGVSAYAGQVNNVHSKVVLAAAASIHSVEARHAAWIRFLNGGGVVGAAEDTAPAPKAFDTPKSEASILKAVKATGFLG